MNKNEYDGTIVLERLSEIEMLDEFYEAIDRDDFSKAKKIMKQAGLKFETIEMVLNEMADV